MDVNNLGQVFTPDFVSEKMISLRKKFGSVMEPSCGDGAISSKIDNIFAIEFDSNVCPDYAHNMDFFDYDVENKYDTIIGNPPYVKHKNICESTKSKLDYRLFNEKSNLYIFFIEKCIKHLKPNGELIFIVPRDFLKATSSKKLNHFLYKSGTITNIVDYGDMRIFKGFNPNCIIFRFEKDNFSRKTLYENVVKNTKEDREFVYSDGQLLFLNNKYCVNFNELFFVKVGGVSGMDEIFRNEEYGNIDFVCSETCKTGKTRRMVYNTLNEYVRENEEKLRSRNIMKITDDNWWMWGRDYYKSDRPRIYVNSKTRNEKPFFTHDCKNYDGSILAIFPNDTTKSTKKDILEICDMLNTVVDWDELGFVCDGRYIFSQRSLENTKLPKVFNKFMNKNKEALW
jgi:adenine-specific DNA-methyltransferase